MIDNCAFLVKCSEPHALYTPVPVRYTSQLTAQQDVAILQCSRIRFLRFSKFK